MFIATVVVSAFLALVALASAAGKLSKNRQVMESMAKVGVPEARIPLLALLEVAGALGVIAGLWWAPIGIAASIGLALYFLGAVVAHVRAKDDAVQPPAVLALLAVAATILRIVTM